MVYQETIWNALMLLPLFDFFLPRLCLSCSRKLESNEHYVCGECLLSLTTAGRERLNYEYNRKFASSGTISGYDSLYVFEKDKPMQQIIHSLKYSGRFKAGIYLGTKLAEAYGTLIKSRGINLILPVPLHRLKKVERGYNQSSYIAKGISRVTGIPVSEKAIVRRKNTLSQTKMNLIERQENMKEAFKVAKPAYIKEKNILLVDDVVTTGSTINECARVLKEKGAAGIYAMSAAIADLELAKQMNSTAEVEYAS